MEAWSYPLGRFVAEEHPTAQQREQWIAEILKFSGELRSTINEMSIDELLTPYRPGGWNALQIVHHLADNDMNAYIRFKRALTEPEPVVGSYREDSWAELPDYGSVPAETSIALLEALHLRFVALLRALSADQFQRTFISPAHGKMTLHVALQRYVWHERHHLAQIHSLLERIR
jgi:uncharacterized damage-inducible protein DinB